MSSFPSRLVDLAVPRELFDHAGEMPPAFKMVIELPSEYFDQPAPGATPPYTSSQVDNNKLVEIQTAVMRKYNSVARRVLNSFRQDVGLSDNQVHMRTSLLGNGVGMKYASQFGNEAIAITVTAKAVRELMGGEESGYMLVIYQKNFGNGGVYIAAIPMKNIAAPSGHVYTNRRSATTGVLFDNNIFCGGSAQLRISKDLHVVASNLLIDKDGNISNLDEPNGNPQRRHFYNTSVSLLGPVVSTTAPNPGITPPYGIGSAPKINFTGKVVYDESGNSVDFSKQKPVLTTPRSWAIGPNAVAAVDANGALWGFSNYYGPRITVRFGLEINNNQNYVASQISTNCISQAQEDAFIPPYFGAPGYDPDWRWTTGTAGPEEASNEFTRYTTGGAADIVYTSQMNQRVMVYSNNGSVDKVSVSKIAGSLTSLYRVSTIGRDRIDWSYGGYSGVFEYDHDINDYIWTGPQWLDFAGTYALGANASDLFMRFRWVDSYSGPSFVQTPYGKKLDGAIGSIYTGFCANGKTCFQTVFIDSGDQCFVIGRDSSDYTDTLCGALGMNKATDSVVSVFLDIKKSDIDKLK